MKVYLSFQQYPKKKGLVLVLKIIQFENVIKKVIQLINLYQIDEAKGETKIFGDYIFKIKFKLLDNMIISIQCLKNSIFCLHYLIFQV